jgi:hypothetical protein
MVFVHCCFGHYHLLQGLVHILNDSSSTLVNSNNISPVHETVRNLQNDNNTVESLTWRNVINPNEMQWPTFERILETSQSLFLTASQSTDEQQNRIEESKTFAGKYITPTLAFSALSTRVIEILKESGKFCGTFPAKNGTEEFIRKYYNPYKGVVFANAAEKGTEFTASTRAERSRKPSIFNIAVEVLRLMIVNHGRCLEEIASLYENSKQAGFSLEDLPFTGISGTWPVYDGSICTGYILLNEDEVVIDNCFKEYGYYHPSLHKTIEALIRCVSTSSSANENKSCKVLYGAAAAFALQNSIKVHKYSSSCKNKKATKSDTEIEKNDELVVFDAKLCSFAINKFSGVLDNIISVTRESSGTVIDRGGSINSELIRHFSLNLPVVPQLEVSFAGLFAKQSNIVEMGDDDIAVNGHLLSLFFRALLPFEDRVPKGKVIQVPDGLVRILMRVIDGCCTLQDCQNDSSKGRQRKR